MGKCRISSTRLRKALQDNDLFEVTQLLGHHYHITGRVVHGQELGRTLGFPTINLDCIPVDKNGEPAVKGVYARVCTWTCPLSVGWCSHDHLPADGDSGSAEEILA